VGRIVRVRTWEEFKGLALEKTPKSLVYIISQGIPARHLTSLKLILPTADGQYIFLDFAKGNKLEKTGISIYTDKKGNRFIRDEDVRSFVKKKLEREDLQVCSYWTI